MIVVACIGVACFVVGLVVLLVRQERRVDALASLVDHQSRQLQIASDAILALLAKEQAKHAPWSVTSGESARVG